MSRATRQGEKAGDVSELMELFIIYKWAEAFTPFKVEAPVEPIEQEASVQKGR